MTDRSRRTMSERSYHGATSRSFEVNECLLNGLNSVLTKHEEEMAEADDLPIMPQLVAQTTIMKLTNTVWGCFTHIGLGRVPIASRRKPLMGSELRYK